MPSEFDIIRRFLSRQPVCRDDVALGIGDDCAIIIPAENTRLAATMDSLVAGIHFSLDDNPYDIGYKSLAVNLSDLAAMGAEPAWALLSLTLPHVDENWITAFCEGFFALAVQHQVQLVGGDLTRGPLAVTLQLQGFLPGSIALRRDGAQVGDGIFVSGQIGDAGLGLLIKKERIKFAPESREKQYFEARLHRPTPRVALGIALRQVASAAIDISDGLLADLGHLLASSGVGAALWLNRIPVSLHYQNLDDPNLALRAGDDYELCFTAATDKILKISDIQEHLGIAITQVGEIVTEQGLQCWGTSGERVNIDPQGFDHFLVE